MYWFKKSQKDIKNESIQKAVPEEKYRMPCPLGNSKWDEEGVIQFTCLQRNTNIKLHTYRCFTKSNQTPQSVTLFFHGLNEHLGLYAHIAQALSKEANSVCVGFDFRGFGKSEGLRGWLESKEQHIEDCTRFIQLIKQLYPGVQLFALGQSLGGLTSYLLGMNDLVDGTILITPALMDNYYNRPYLKKIALILGLLSPTWSPFPASYPNASKNPQVLEDNLKDPYINWNSTLPGTARVLLKMMRDAPNTFKNYKKPFLIISGGMDQIVDPDVGHELMKLSTSTDKELIYYENMWHDCIAEQEILEIIPQLIKWIKKRQ
ncbi:unnamed protein product [Paramecium pentaurelia]|uniref:Serine aminopeptidase S33 domain-containing protein n=1 Tax=Paramecium pentaurelia TaxID=43138 RepID=A0A8S1RWX8_9CILI|nr:unnamed protein product [Paramecium pentaurelia]